MSKSGFTRCQRWAGVALVGVLSASGCSAGGDGNSERSGPDLDDAAMADDVLVDPTSRRPAEGGAGASGTATAAPRSATSPGGAATGAGPAREGGDPTVLRAGPGVEGVTDSTIELGLMLIDLDTAAAVMSAASGTEQEYEASDPKGTQAAIDFVNKTGGIAGRQVKPIYYNANVGIWSTPEGRDRDMQAACAAWTEDHRVFAFSAYWNPSDIALDCAAKNRTPMFAQRQNQAYPSQSRVDAMAGYWYGPDVFVADRRERVVGHALIDHGFFGKDAKVGLLIEDSAGIREGVAKGLKPALAESGIKPAVEIVYPDMIHSPWQNYALQFQAAGVTHVVFSAVTGVPWAALFMMRAAESQQYRPRWGVGTDDITGLLAQGPPPEQLQNVFGVGWKPTLDVDDLTTPQSENTRLCNEAMRNAGQSEGVGWPRCEFLLFLRAALARAPELSVTGLAAGVAKLGDSYLGQETIGGATRFGPGRVDGIAVIRTFVYDAATNKFRYVSEPEPVRD